MTIGIIGAAWPIWSPTPPRFRQQPPLLTSTRTRSRVPPN